MDIKNDSILNKALSKAKDFFDDDIKDFELLKDYISEKNLKPLTDLAKDHIPVYSAVRNYADARNDNKEAIEKMNKAFEKVCVMDDLCDDIFDEIRKRELETVKSFESVSDTFSKIHNRPEFSDFPTDGFDLPEIDYEKIHLVSVGAGVALGTAGSLGLGAGVGVSVIKIAEFLVGKFGKASTGTPIKMLHGAPKTNAIYARLGGGAKSIGGKGKLVGVKNLKTGGWISAIIMALTVLDLTSNVVKNEAEKKADLANEMAEKYISISNILSKLYNSAVSFNDALSKTEKLYTDRHEKLKMIVDSGKCDWNEFTVEEKTLTHNLVLTVQVLYKMCSTELFPEKSEEIETDEKTLKIIKKLKNKTADEEGDILLNLVSDENTLTKDIYDTEEKKTYRITHSLNTEAVSEAADLGHKLINKG